MEQSRRRFYFALSAVGALAAAGLAWALWSRAAVTPHEVPAIQAGSERITVEVLNGTRQRGLARSATRALRQAGFDVVYFGTVGDSFRVTQSLARRGDSSRAALVSRALGAGVVRLATDTLLRVDVTVLLGADYKPPPGIRP